MSDIRKRASATNLVAGVVAVTVSFGLLLLLSLASHDSLRAALTQSTELALVFVGVGLGQITAQRDERCAGPGSALRRRMLAVPRRQLLRDDLIAFVPAALLGVAVGLGTGSPHWGVIAWFTVLWPTVAFQWCYAAESR